MADDNKQNDEEKSDKKGEFKLPSRTLVVWVLILGVIMLLMMFRTQTQAPPSEISYSELAKKVDDGQIISGTITYNQQSPYLRKITGSFYKTKIDADGKTILDKSGGKFIEIPFRTGTPLAD